MMVVMMVIAMKAALVNVSEEGHRGGDDGGSDDAASMSVSEEGHSDGEW